MKKLVILLSVLFLSLAILPVVFADEKEHVELAYTCLKNKINQTGCSSFSFEQKVFSLLAVGKCQEEVIAANLSNQCWPNSGCTLKSTSQAILALNKDINTTKAEQWLLSQTSTPTGIDWFLEIESLKPVKCTISYSGSSYTISIGANKKISSGNLGSCLGLSTGAYNGYFLLISPSCYNKEFAISCNESFITTLLFKKQGSDSNPLHVLEEVNSASANGETTEKVDALCFSQKNSQGQNVCNYEGSLWATLVLYYLDYDVSPYMPYLLTMKDDNQIYLPESFLYFLTGKLKTDLLSKQISNKYWQESGERYYDTALALWPLYYETSFEKQNSKNWLLSVQGKDGCWNNGNIRDTAFILYSVWPRYYEPPGPAPECTKDSDCPAVDCTTVNCDITKGICIYKDFSCKNNDNCCPSGCTISNDNDCKPPSACTTDADCKTHNFNSSKYCLKDDVYKNVSIWNCINEICVENKTINLIENCTSSEECYYGNCLTLEDECDDDFDCPGTEVCVNNVCVEETLDCEPDNGFCMSAINCEGEILYEYECQTPFRCCNTEKSLSTCSAEGGKICTSDEYCAGGTGVKSSDLDYDEICCVGGYCKTSGGGTTTDNSCGANNGTCRISCHDDEEETSFYTCDYGDICCLSTKKTKNGGYAWIWILLILILLAALGIVFRDKLRTQWMKLKSKFGGKKSQEKRPSMFSMAPPSQPIRRIFPRRIFPPVKRPSPMRKSGERKLSEKEKPKSELDDVLKKLKDMGK